MPRADEMRKKLIELGMSEEYVAKLTGKSLKEVCESKMMEDFSSILEDSSNDHEDSPLEDLQTLEDSIGVKYGSKDWTPWVLSQLEEDEMYNGNPKASGLRRVLESIADISSCGVKSFNVSPDGKVTVHYEIAAFFKLNTPVGFIGANNQIFEIADTFPQLYSGLADCDYVPTDTFGRHAAATAETKAYARALRNALCLSVCTSDEMMSTQQEKPSRPTSVTPVQVRMARMKLQQNSVEEEKAIKEYGLDKRLEDFTYDEMAEFVKFINKYQER